MEDYSKYKDFEEKTWQRHLYDINNLPFKEYLFKYHKSMNSYNSEEWSKWQSKYIEPGFSKDRYEEMIKNFGYSSYDDHDFIKQNMFYNDLQKDERLDEETRKFIGFMAGSHFFDKHESSLQDWFNSNYWTRPDLTDNYLEYKLDYTINQLLDMPYGLNYFKSILITLNHWRR
ncbi:hypothetical protein D1815_15545 [Aquimarina sp. AD1]|uniref:hypothetical protein n=1 Tax=Aquimarina sp. (strain AD1) TaxID=1714848 RepID=UPI000E4F607A|nr:hypothetical protein [Aquimarina sp. AD1]AXT57090.1 hypothetical protein D1815_15545 [Aquimarina sp. AD1]RKN23248.1 hypothetical protein D7035_11470 [Aquimarina sp. AD1]